MLRVQQVLVNGKGENALDGYFDKICIDTDYIKVSKNGLYGLYSRKTLDCILSCQWDKIESINSYIIAQGNHQINVIDLQGATLFCGDFDKVVLYKNGFLVFKNNKQGFISKEGKVIISCTCRKIEVYDKALIVYRGNRKKEVYNYSGKKI